MQRLHLSVKASRMESTRLDAIIATADDRMYVAPPPVPKTMPPKTAPPKLAQKKIMTKQTAQAQYVQPQINTTRPEEGILLVPAPSTGGKTSYGARYLAPVDNRSDVNQAPLTTGSINVSTPLILPPQAFQGPTKAQLHNGQSSTGSSGSNYGGY